jgi:hypothetical protein
MKRDEIFERLEPPPNGLGTLRARIERANRPRRVWRIPALAFAAAAVAVVIWIVVRRDDPVRAARQHQGSAEMALGLAPLPTTPATLDDDARATTALLEVQTSNPKVAFYWVGSTTWR